MNEEKRMEEKKVFKAAVLQAAPVFLDRDATSQKRGTCTSCCQNAVVCEVQPAYGSVQTIASYCQ